MTNNQTIDKFDINTATTPMLISKYKEAVIHLNSYLSTNETLRHFMKDKIVGAMRFIALLTAQVEAKGTISEVMEFKSIDTGDIFSEDKEVISRLLSKNSMLENTINQLQEQKQNLEQQIRNLNYK